MKITRKDKVEGAVKIRIHDIPMGTVFDCTGLIGGVGPYLRIYTGAIDLNNPGYIWADDFVVYYYCPLRAELIIHGPAD